MADRTAAEVLAEKLTAIWRAGVNGPTYEEMFRLIAARLAEDPAITVRTHMMVERFVVEFHYDSTRHLLATPLHWADELYEAVTTHASIDDFESHRVIVRPLDGDR
jgi:hypothetical protein